MIFVFFLGEPFPLAVASACSLFSGGILCILVSFVLSFPRPTPSDETWECTRNIDNPLCPWSEIYARYEPPSPLLVCVSTTVSLFTQGGQFFMYRSRMFKTWEGSISNGLSQTTKIKNTTTKFSNL